MALNDRVRSEEQMALIIGPRPWLMYFAFFTFNYKLDQAAFSTVCTAHIGKVFLFLTEKSQARVSHVEYFVYKWTVEKERYNTSLAV